MYATQPQHAVAEHAFVRDGDPHGEAAGARVGVAPVQILRVPHRDEVELLGCLRAEGVEAIVELGDCLDAPLSGGPAARPMPQPVRELTPPPVQLAHRGGATEGMPPPALQLRRGAAASLLARLGTHREQRAEREWQREDTHRVGHGSPGIRERTQPRSRVREHAEIDVEPVRGVLVQELPEAGVDASTLH